MPRMTWLLDLYHVDPADTSDVQILRVSTNKVPNDYAVSGEYTPLIMRWPTIRMALADGQLSSGPSAPSSVTIPLARHVHGSDRLSVLAGRSVLGQRAYYRGVGVGGDGTIYTLSSPLVVVDGPVIEMVEDLHVTDIVAQPHSKAHRVTLPTQRLIGYANGLRGNGSTSEVEIVGYNAVPTMFTLIALMLTPRVWPGGASDKMTLFDQASVKGYITKSGDYERAVNLDVRNAANTAWHTLTGTAWEPDEGANWMSFRFNTTTRATRLGFNTDFEDIAAPADFGALAGNWFLLGDEFDSIAGAFAIFSEWLTDAQLSSYFQRRLTGEESDLDGFWPGESVAGSLLDYAAVNRASPLDGTITDATAAPLFTGQADQAGAARSELIGYVRNAPVRLIDSARNIGQVAGHPVGAVAEVFDRSVDQEIETIYGSPLDLWDGGSPTSSGQVSVTPHLGGIVRYNDIQDGAELSANVSGKPAGAAIDTGRSLYLGSDLSNSTVNFGTQLDSVFNTGEWSLTLWTNMLDFGTSIFPTAVFSNDHLVITAKDRGNVIGGSPEGIIRWTIAIETDGPDLALVFDADTRESPVLTVEAKNDGSGGSFARLLVYGRVVASDSDGSNELLSTTGADSLLSLASGGADQVIVLPMWIFNSVENTDADAEEFHRPFLFNYPLSSHANIEGLWFRHGGAETSLQDETANGYDGTVSAGAVWGPGIGCMERLLCCDQMFSLSETAVSFEESAWSASSDPIGVSFGTEVSSANAAADFLRGGGLYVFLLQDGVAYVGQVQDPATGTPASTHRAENVSMIQKGPPPSSVVAQWGNNPRVQSTQLAGANVEQEAFASAPIREEFIEVGADNAEPNRTLYADDAAPQGRKIMLNTHFMSARAAQAEGQRWADMWEDVRGVRDKVVVIGGYSGIRPGQLITIENEDLPGGEADVLVVDVILDEPADKLVVR